LKPIFKKDGTVTVGNSCMLTDGAGAVVLMPGEMARAEGRSPLGYLRGFAYAGCDPKRMGLGPAFAISKLLSKLSMRLDEFDLMELNEAFAAVVLANERAFVSQQFSLEHLGRIEPLGQFDLQRVNVNGGAIALGHPIGATGAILAVKTIYELHRTGGRYGLVTMCIGGGQGIAAIFERL
jgi:acetyl-CoA C-acetyltransferase/acetyl-CoA acyltransferase